MNYSKVKEEISRKSFNEKFFIPEVTGLTVQGFNKALRNKTLKVSDLEKISKGLGLPMSRWFLEEDQVAEQGAIPVYGEPASITIQRLNRQIDQLLDQLEKLKHENETYMEKLGIRKASGYG